MKNMEAAREALLTVVGAILQSDGCFGLKKERILRMAGKHERSHAVERCFGSYEGLLFAYARKTDFWIRLRDTLTADHMAGLNSKAEVQAFVYGLFKELLPYFYASQEMQELLWLSLSKPRNKLKKWLSEERERIGAPLLAAIDRLWGQHEADLYKARLAYVMGTCYVGVYHALRNRSTFLGLDINKPEDRELFLESVELLLSL
ncbi:hypothetical protein SAMN05216436_1424 [bacterium A37T11]|nr:hypothetical protein SAMN05216436_1424 [bacterium A37T11]